MKTITIEQMSYLNGGASCNYEIGAWVGLAALSVLAPGPGTFLAADLAIAWAAACYMNQRR